MVSGAILCLVATRVSAVATLTLVLFLGDVVTLLVSIAWMAREICGSHDAVRYEAQQLRGLSLASLRQKSAAQGADG